MRYLRTPSGFTLVELVIVLAISALLLGGILAGQGSIQNHTAFTSAIDSTRLQLKELQNEANQSLASRTAGGTAGASDFTNFGKLVEFEHGATPTQMKTWTLVEDSAKANLFKCDEHDVTLNQQVNFINADNGGGSPNGREAIIFGRDPKQTYIVPGFSDNAGVSSVCNASASPSPPPPTPAPLCPGFVRDPTHPAGTGASCPVPPAPSVPTSCSNDPAYQCGLYGQYYDATDKTTRVEMSDFIDTQVGTSLGQGESSYPSFKQALTDRAFAPNHGVSVNWSGEILLEGDAGDPQAHTYCFAADQGSTAKITVGGVQYLTNNYGAGAAAGTGCNSSIPASTPPGWYPIDIQYGHLAGSGNTALARLYEVTGGVTQEIPGNDLRTSVSHKQTPPESDFADGLYGQYYADSSFSNRISAYTDPAIGDAGIKFSYDKSHISNTGVVSQDDSFTPKILWNTASSSNAQKSVKWTGQIKINPDPGPPNTKQICEVSDSQATVTINNVVVINDATPHIDNRQCGTLTLVSPSTAWYNIEVDYQKQGIGVDGTNASVQLSTLNINNGKYVEVPTNQLRRPLDWTGYGNQGTCNPNNFQCNNNGDSQPQGSTLVENTGSSTSDGTCAGSNRQGQLTYTATNITPDSTYNLDINYYNDGSKDAFGGVVPAPPSYQYQVCVYVNGNIQHGGNPVNLRINEPSVNPRTYTMSGITVPGSGNATIVLDWINDSYSPTWYLGSAFGGYDSNFGITRLDLYRNLDSNGNLSAAKAAPAVATSVPSQSKTQNLVSRISSLLAPAAHAASSCDKNVLNPANYTGTCFATLPSGSPYATLIFQVPGYTQNGCIDVNTVDGSIERRINDSTCS